MRTFTLKISEKELCAVIRDVAKGLAEDRGSKEELPTSHSEILEMAIGYDVAIKEVTP